MAISRKTNKAGITFDSAQNSLLFAEDWNNMGDQVEGLMGRVSALESTGAPGSRQAVYAASAHPTITLDITSGVEASITMDASTILQLAYTANASNYAVLYIKNQPGGTITWPNMLWDTVDGAAPFLSAGDGLMTVIGIYERFGVVRGFLIDRNVRVNNPTLTTPVTGGILQLLLNEGQGMPQDSSGNLNHITVNTGVWNSGGGMTFGSGQHARTAFLTGFDVKQSYWLFEVVKEINLSYSPGNFGTLGGFSGDSSGSDFIWHYVNTAGTGLGFSARSSGSANWSQEVLPNSIFTPTLAFRTAVVWVYDAPNQRHSQYVLHNNSRVGHSLIPAGLQWATSKALFNLSGIYRPTIDSFLNNPSLPTKKEYVFLKQGLPTEADLRATYNFARNVCGGRPGDNLPALP